MERDDETMTISEAAEYLECSPWTLRDQVTRGEVPHHRRGRVKGVYFTREDLEQITSLHARPVQSAPSIRTARRAGTTPRTAPAVIPEEFARLKEAR